MKNAEHKYFEKGQTFVTQRSLHTRFKDEALAPLQSVQIGLEPLGIAGITCLGLVVFSYQFGDLLHFHEQVMIVTFGLLATLAGLCVTSLRVGQHMHERVVMWGPIWTIAAVRNAIFEAGHDRENASNGVVLLPDIDE